MDECARDFAKAQRRLVESHSGMARTGTISSGVLNRLLYRSSMTRGLVHFGFSQFCDLPRTGDPLGNWSFEELVAGVVGGVVKRSEVA